MLYLVLFSTMAIGFYAATTMSAQVSNSDERVMRSFIATESGLDFLRFHLARVNIPPLSATPTQDLYNNVRSRLESTSNFTGMTVGLNGRVISIPAEANGWIKLDAKGDQRFRATITDWPDVGRCVVTIYGQNGKSVSRAISMDFTRVPRINSAFDNAVASKGGITMESGGIIAMKADDNKIAKMMSALDPTVYTNPAITISDGVIGGKLGYLEGSSINMTGGSVDGISNPAVVLNPDNNHIKAENDPPAFPIVDTTPYAALATTPYNGANGIQKNVYIPANAGTPANPLRITGSKQFQGILYIKSPNVVELQGSVDMYGFIVFEQNANPATSTDKLMITGNFKPRTLPSTPEFAPIRASSGVSILAPTAHLLMDGNGGTQNKNDELTNFKGNIIVNSFEFGGSADIIIDNGSIITLKEGPGSAKFAGKNVRFMSTGGNNLPVHGVTFGRAFRADPTTYEELMP